MPTAKQFLHRVDLAEGRGTYVETSAERLRRTPFLDGRERFWDGATERHVPAVLAVAGAQRPAYVFHVSFCGSTLLATLLDDPGSVLSLKEPHALVDVADGKRRSPGNRGLSQDEALRAIEASAAEMAQADERVVIKPSNWANTLIPLLCAPMRRSRAVFVTMPRYDFIRAVFRGGRDRMAYTLRAAEHLVANTTDMAELYRRAVRSSRDPYQQVARIAAVSHLHQERLFARAIAANDWGPERWVTFDDIQRRPFDTVDRVARVLALDAVGTGARRQGASLAVHSKDRHGTFSADRERAQNDEVEHHHRAALRDAVDWIEAAA